MTKEKIVFCSHCSNHLKESFGAYKLMASSQYFHPEIPFYMYGTDDIRNVWLRKYGHPNIDWYIMNPLISIELADKYEMVVHFDSDSIITGRLDELINAPEDVVCVRNNNDFGGAGRGVDTGTTYKNVGVNQYLNAGLIGSRKKEFWLEWERLNGLFAADTPFGEQGVLNELLYNRNLIGGGEFTFNILDAIDKKVYYGVSCLSGTETHWDSLKSISLNENNDLVLNDKIVKIVHHAGGHSALPKLQIDKLFNPQVAEYLNKIVG